MISMTVIEETNYITGDSHDDWVVIENEQQIIPLTGFFFRCATPAECGCNTTYFNETNSNCEAFIFRMDEIGYNFKITRPYSYLSIISQIVSLSILGYLILRMILAIIFRVEKRRFEGDAVTTHPENYRDLEDS